MNSSDQWKLIPLANFHHLNRGPEESPSMGSLHLDVFTQPRPKADIEAGSPTQSNLIVDLADTSLERAPPIFRERHLSEAAASASAGARFLVERNHDVGGLNDGCRRHPDLELEFVDRLVRDRGRDDLTAAQFEAHVGGGRTLGYLNNLTGQLV